MCVATLQIARAIHELGNTYDESLHVAAGMELLSRGSYTYEVRHPPLVRVLTAIGPFLGGARSAGNPNQFFEGDAVLRAGVGFRNNVELARAAIVPFFLLLGVLVFVWTRLLAGEVAASAAVVLMSFTPALLANAGLATTDLAATTGITAAALATRYWLASPYSWWRSLGLGAACALAVGTKLSAVPFLAVAGLLMLMARAPWRQTVSVRAGLLPLLPRVLSVGAVAGVLLWASYGFEVGRIRGVPMPMPSLLRGIRFLINENREGHIAYLLGEAYVGGRALFFPMVLGVKTPLALIGLSGAGVWVLLSRWHATRRPDLIDPLLLLFAILSVAITSNINMGVRHILAVYPLLALCGGVAAAWLLDSPSSSARLVRRVAVGGAFASMAIGVTRTHPDYLAYFNVLAGDEPGAIVVDSDLDWGQDIERLADTVRARKIESVSLAYYGTTDRPEATLPRVQRLSRGDPAPRATGWLAISETLYRRGTAQYAGGAWTSFPNAYGWLRPYRPVARVGRSIRLYYIPPADGVGVASRSSPLR